jgi:hypothetical protein
LINTDTLGLAYLDGRGVPRNEVRGVQLLEKSSKYLIEAFDDLNDYKRRKERGIGRPK